MGWGTGTLRELVCDVRRRRSAPTLETVRRLLRMIQASSRVELSVCRDRMRVVYCPPDPLSRTRGEQVRFHTERLRAFLSRCYSATVVAAEGDVWLEVRAYSGVRGENRVPCAP